jgi:two-component system, chemotaxis family, chemotaxis protein CheY
VSLNGNLEDLPLLDILQIVSFSKKTGYLSIRTDGGEGAIVFQDGFVVAAFSAETPPFDARYRNLPAEARTPLLRQNIERGLEQLIRLREGQFSFSLTDGPPRKVGPRDISEETLPQGINAQELLLDLARGMDEDRRDSTAALEASFAEPPDDVTVPPELAAQAQAEAEGEALRERSAERPSAAPPPPPPAPPPVAAAAPAAAPAAETEAEISTILLVDDEDEVRRILAERFTRGGYNVVEAEDPDAAVKKAGRLGKASIPFLLVSDLGMPTSGGTSFQGGFEVVKRLWKMNLRPPVLLMGEALTPTLQARARQMEIAHFVFKPGLSKLDPEQFEADLRAFATKILTDILPKLGRSPSPAPPRASQGSPAEGAPAVPAASRKAPAEAPAAATPPATPDEMSRDFEQLQRWLEELRGCQDATQISALVMRVARDCFERGVLFVVKHETMRGLGGYGAAPRDEKLGLLVREVAIPLGEPSLFARVAVGRKPHVGPWPDDKWARHLLGKIGRFQSSGFALLPLLTNRETVAILFGDNADSGRPLGRLAALDTFVNQAGIALENAFLQRKVTAMQTP